MLCLHIIVYKYTSALILSVYFIVIKQCPYLTGMSTNVNVTAVLVFGLLEVGLLLCLHVDSKLYLEHTCDCFIYCFLCYYSRHSCISH